MHDHHTLRLHGLVHVVGDEDDSDAILLIELAHNSHDLAPPLRVEHGGRLVEHYAARHHGDHARDRHALLLAARQAVRRLFAVFVHADGFERIVHALTDLRGRHAHVFERERHVLLDNCGDQLVIRVLEYHGHGLAHLVGVVFVARVHHIDIAHAAGRQADRVEAARERTLARAVVPQNGDELAALDREVHTLEHGHSELAFLDRIGILQIFSFDDFTHKSFVL